MRVAFVADDGGFEADEDALICGVSCCDHWLTFQCAPEGVEDDWGVHLEYSGQANGGNGCIAACRLSAESLAVDLGKQLGQLTGVTGFDISLRLSPEAVAALREGLRRVFRGQPKLLSIG
jgi:hypothetical protein